MEIVLAAMATFLVQLLKKVFETSEWATLGIVLLVSFVLSAFYVWAVEAEMWGTLKTVLVYAGAIYTFIIARFEQGSSLRKMISG